MAYAKKGFFAQNLLFLRKSSYLIGIQTYLKTQSFLFVAIGYLFYLCDVLINRYTFSFDYSMHRFRFILIFLLILTGQTILAQVEKPYTPNNEQLPEWVQKMYQEKADVGEVLRLKEAYYLSHPFVKNAHTQYFKRWIRFLQKNGDDNRLTPEERLAKQENEVAYLRFAERVNKGRGASSAWSCIGPMDFDKGAAAMSYAPGAAHVYTTEQSISNPNILYAGSAEAGLWKSVDKGLNWSPLTYNMPIFTVYAIEIDYTDANIIYFSANGKLYKSTDGGTTINQIGDAVFNSYNQDIKDIIMHPANHNILLLASDKGLYRTTDAGNNWTQIMGSEFQEIEFQPGNPNVVYVIRQVGNHTEFYKSSDNGLSFTPKAGGYPGISAVSSITFPSAKFNATTDYIQAATSVNLGGATIPDFTIEMWVKTNGWTSDPALFSNKNWASGLNKGFVIAGRTNGTGWKFNIGNSSQKIDMNGGTINDGSWHHIAVVYRTTGTKELYQDGVLITSSTTNIASPTSPALQMALGQDGTLAYASAFKGEIAEVRVWNTALTASTLSTYQWQFITAGHPNYSNLLHYWKLNEGSGTTAADAKGTNTGTIHGAAAWTVSNQYHIITTSLTGSEEQKRTEISVSAANPNVIYVLATGAANGGSGLYGIYKSTDAGDNWTFQCCGTGPVGVPSPTNFNLMGWDDGGQDDGGQYYYDLSLGASPSNADSIFICGVNLWYSANGGVNVNCPSKWSHSAKVNYVHADIHDIKIYGNDMWLSCDGGIFYSNDRGANWNKRQFGIAGTDFWGFGAGFQDGSVMLGGAYHNGTMLKDGNTYVNGWLCTDGGDGTRGFVNPGKPRIAYSDYNKKLLSGNRTIAPTTYSFSKNPNTEGNMEFHPRCYNIIYSPVDSQLWKTLDDGVSWTMMKNFGNGNTIEAVRIAWANPDVMYASTSLGLYTTKKLWKSLDAGVTWTEITPSSATINGNTTMNYKITVSSDDPNTLWIALTHPYNWYTADGYKIFKSTNGGTSWANITTTTLNGEYIEDIVHQRGSNGGIYIGTARTVYYRNDVLSDWQLFNNQLPVKTYCTRVIPYYKGGKLRNASNRSVYEVDFYEDTPPSAQISADKLSSECNRDTVYYVNHSACRAGATFTWSFPGGIPSSSTAEMPKVVYTAAGAYDVTLTVTDAFGSSTQTITNFITINAACNPDSLPGNALSLTNSGDYASVPTFSNLNTNTLTLMAWIKPNGNQASYAGILFSGAGGASGLDFRNSNQLGYHWANTAGSYNWAGGPTPTMNEWHHVALVITPNTATVYLDGIGYTRSGTNLHSAVDFSTSTLLIGSDRGNSSRNYKGLIEEVCVYNRALSQNEIRDYMFLTKNNPNIGTTPILDPSLIAYYQFNENTGKTYDKAGLRHASMVGAAARSTSTAPIGGGTSARLTVNSGGAKVFPNTGMTMTFPASGTYPNGDLVVTRLDNAPDQLPGAYTTGSNNYWIVSNYGTNPTFSTLTDLQFHYGTINSGLASSPAYFKMYKRASRADGNTWGTALDDADAATQGANGTITFSSNNGITSFSQFKVMQEGSPLPIENLTFKGYLVSDNTIKLDWHIQGMHDYQTFVVERSTNGKDFSPLATLPADKSVFAYQTYDLQPNQGANYYRLKTFDVDGKSEVSNIVAILLNQIAESYILAPNPFQIGNVLQIYTNNPDTEKVHLTLYDEAGKTIYSQEMEGNCTIDTKGWNPGVYLYRIQSPAKLYHGTCIGIN